MADANGAFYSLREAAQRLGRTEAELPGLLASVGAAPVAREGRLMVSAADLARIAAAAARKPAAGSAPAPTAAPAVLAAVPPPRRRPAESAELSGSGLFDAAEISQLASEASSARTSRVRATAAEDEAAGSSSGLFNLADASPAPREKARPFELDGNRRLFLDDSLFQTTQGVAFTVHPALRHSPTPVLTADPKLEPGGLSLGGAVLYDTDEKLLKMWYSAGTTAGRSVCLAVSRNGTRWQRASVRPAGADPAAPPGPVVLQHPSFEGFGELVGLVRGPVRSPGEPRYRTAFGHWSPSAGTKAVLTAVSADGVSWKRSDRPAVPQLWDSACLMRDDAGDRFVLWGSVSHYGRRTVLRTESEDFVNWSPPEPITWIGRESASSRLSGLCPFSYADSYVGFKHLTADPPGSDGTGIALAVSRDGWNWKTPDGEMFLRPGPAGNWDDGEIRLCCPPLRVGKELWFFYSGRRGRPPEPGAPPVPPPGGGVGFARLRRDGFVSVGAGAAGGLLITRPVILASAGLHLNAAAKGGEIRVRLTDLQGQMLEGMESDPVGEDDTDLPVSWPAGRSLAPYRGRPVRLEFRLRNARLYSMWTQ